MARLCIIGRTCSRCSQEKSHDESEWTVAFFLEGVSCHSHWQFRDLPSRKSRWPDTFASTGGAISPVSINAEMGPWSKNPARGPQQISRSFPLFWMPIRDQKIPATPSIRPHTAKSNPA